MKHEKYIIRLLQALTFTSIILFLGFLFFQNYINPPQNIDSRQSAEPRPKVKRNREAKNLSYTASLEQAVGAFSRGDSETAVQFYRSASEKEPKAYLPYEKIGDVEFLNKKYQQAFENFSMAASLNPAKPDLKLKIIRSLLGLRKILDAKSQLEKIQPETQESVYYKGLIAAYLNNQEEAKNLLTKSLTLGEDAELKTYAQKILTVYRDFELSRDAEIEFLQTMLALALNQSGEYGLAIELAFDAIKTKADYRDSWIVLGHSFLNEYKWFDAQDAFKKVVDLDAGHPSGFFFRGVAQKKLGKLPEAMSDFKKALELNWRPKILAQKYIADIYFEQKKFNDAFTLYKEIAATDPSDIQIFVRPMALAINHLKLPKEALILAQKAAVAHPNTAMANNLLGWAYAANGNAIKAHQYLNEAIKIDPTLAAAYLNLGQLFELERKPEEALKNYDKAMQLARKSYDKSIEAAASEKYDVLTEKMQNGSSTVLPATQQPYLIQPTFNLGSSENLNKPNSEIIRQIPSLSLQ